MSGKGARETNRCNRNATESKLTTDLQFIELVMQLSDRLGFSKNSVQDAEVENLSGNMNRVRRIRLKLACGDAVSFVIKHVPEGGKLGRYPSIVFPESRLAFEIVWFGLGERVRPDCSVQTPVVLNVSDDGRTLIMEDLSPLCSLGDLMREVPAARAGVVLSALGGFLAYVHKTSVGSVEFSNPGAALNRPYVFRLPFEEPERMRMIWQHQAQGSEQKRGGVDLEELTRLQGLYLRKWQERVCPVLIELERAFKQGRLLVLTHGDLHADSVLVLPDHKLGVVDAELCDFGASAFDLGMLSAHILACTVASELGHSVMASRLSAFLTGYMDAFWTGSEAAAAEKKTLLKETAMYCGAEILRRLLGAAGFPFALTSEQFQVLLDASTRLLLSPADSIGWFDHSERRF